MATKKRKTAPKKSNVVSTNFKQGKRKSPTPRARPGDFDPDANVKQVEDTGPAPSVADMPSAPGFDENSATGRAVPRFDDEVPF